MRNFFAGFGNGSGAFAAAAVCLVLLAAGYYVQSGRGAVDAPERAALVAPTQAAKDTQADDALAPEPDSTETAAKPQTQADAEPEASAAPEQPEPVVEASTPDLAPSFDEVRREADGVTVIAGRAAPGTQVSVLQDGKVVATAKADGSGKFATLALIAPDGKPHVLSLLQQGEAGETASEDEIILAPMAPVAVAAVEEQAPAASAPVDEDAPAQDVAQDAAPQDEIAVTDTELTQAEVSPAEIAEGAIETEGTVTAPDAAPETTLETAAIAAAPAQEATQAEEPASESDAEPLRTQNSAPQETQNAAAALVTEQPNNTATDAPAVQETKAPEQVAVLKSTATGVELLNTPSPEAMTNVALDTISYSEVGEVELAGRAQSDTASVRVYLDNNSVISLPVDAEGRWRGELPDVDEGIYTLRVDEVSSSGKVTSRVETPFKREASAVLEAAAAEQDGPISAITVQEGATLWAIARERYGDGALYVRVFEANNKAIRDPDLIYPGQVFDLPD
jgi:nucleoid-associated protein YgaU